MNKTFQALLLVSILTSPVICQEPDTLDFTNVPESREISRKPDTLDITTAPKFREISRKPDTLDFTDAPLWESDTLYTVQGADTLPGYHQEVLVQSDSVKPVEPDFSHSPSKAIMYALALPGLGQGYNKKYYKIPIVWAAIGAAGYAITFNTRNYNRASQDYALLPDDSNERYLRYWRRNLELSYIGLMLVYALQVIDAYVDAQLYSWDVNQDLSLRVSPSIQPLMAPQAFGNPIYGISCSIDLKNR